MKKENVLIAVLFCFQLCFVNGFGTQASAGTIVNYPLPSCYSISEQLSLTVDGINTPVIKNTAVYDYAHFSLSGTVTIEITANEAINSFEISPLSYNLAGVVSGNKLTFTIDKSRYLIIKINNLRHLIIAADDLEIDVPAATGTGVYNITESPYNADVSGIDIVTSSIQNAIDDASEAGGGIVYVPAGVYKSASLVLKSNVSLYLAGGAVIRSTANPADFVKKYRKSSLNMDVTWFISTEPYSSHIKIYGRGTIDGNGLYMRTVNNYLNNLIVPLQTSYFVLDGIVCRDSGLWGVTPSRSDHVTISNTKHFNENDIAHEDDAVDIQECQDVIVTHTIMISEDDAFSTKTWEAATDIADNWPGDPELLNNILLDDCVAWSRCATFKVGFGNVQPQSNIVIRNATSYRSMRAIGVNLRYVGNKSAENITFENIDIEGFWPRTGNSSKWLDIYNVNDTGPIKNVTLKNINVRNFGLSPSTIKGLRPESQVNGVHFENITVPGQPGYATSLLQMNIRDVNYFVNNITILPSAGLAENLALNKPIKVTTTVDPTTYPAQYAVDGNRLTKWWSVYNGFSQTAVVDLGSVYNIEKISIQWAEGFAQKYDLEVSNDSIGWTKIKSITDNTVLLNEHEALPAYGRYVKMLGLGRGNGLGYTIAEFEIYGSLYPPSYMPLPYHSNYGQRHYPERIAAFKADPLHENDIVFMGDSQTELGGDWAARLGISNVRNRGIASDLTYGVLARLGEICYYKPKSVYMLIGINDLSKPDFTPLSVMDSISKIVKTIKRESPATQIYLQTILPTSSPDLVDKIRETNELLRERSASIADAKITAEPFTLIDLYPLFTDENGNIKAEYTIDGVHLNESGYSVWVTKLLGDTPLPVTLIGLNGSVEGKSALIRWTTATEENSSYFEVQRSRDGINFIKAGEINAAGNSGQTNNYSFSDDSPFPGINYYRLRMVDTDNSFAYSRIISLKTNNEEMSLKAFPNPVRHRLQLEIPGSSGKALIEVYNVLNQLMISQEEFIKDKIDLDVEKLPVGMYIVRVCDGGVTSSYKFLKQ